MMQSKKVTVAQNDVISTHCYMFSECQAISCPWNCCPLQRRRRRCNRQRCCCYTPSPSQDAARLLHATVCAIAFHVMTALLLRVRMDDKICACSAIAGFSLQKENKNATRSSDSHSTKQTNLHASTHKHTQTRTQMSSLQ